MPSTVNIGLIGAGRIGKVHAQNLACRVPGARLAGV
ncbi:MAG TPA: inositol 2-dehydrogenase, partial [Anaerolineae bacterium]|nr:inositol 2-dehydrogenase [Anaerolineae bacterium]